MAKTGSKASKKSGKRSSGASTSKHKKTKKVKDPNAPKRAKSAYMFWLSENRSRIAKPGMSVIDVSKAAGIEWGKIKDKSKYEKMASQDKQRYEAEMGENKIKS
ncbi:HMG box [Onchocerca flexuosa]|uniref:HMG box n=1 Tax=Onchocerca flexuosa TaxID=387005 RepID=A0A238BKT3_9BILA|nr:HMG box [Onchocerca flexuosa]